ncbi:MAG: amidohydrolase family protein [Lautropia sp.]
MSTAPASLLIRSGLLLDPEGELDRPPRADLLVHDGRIAAIGEAAAGLAAGLADCEVLDAAHLLVMPGFVNGHYHSHDVLQRGLFEQMPLDVWSLHSFPSFYPRRPVPEVVTRTRVGAAECIRGGITTVQDMVTVVGPDREHVEAIVDTYAGTGLRVCLGLQIGDRPTIDTMPFWREMLPPALAAGYTGALSPGAMQALVTDVLDLPTTDRITWGLAPSTPERCSEALLAWIRDLSEARGLRVFTHVYESRAQAVLARVRQQIDGGSFVRLLRRAGLLGPRLTIAHGIWITREEIDLLAQGGASLISSPVANLKLLDGIAPVHDYLEAGVNVGLGGDNCSCSDTQNLFQAMKGFAIFLGYQDREGREGAARRAFRAATLGSAKALGLEGRVGCLRVGSRADLALVDTRDGIYHPMHSAVRQLVYAETGRNVSTVIIDGRPVMRDGRLLTFDESAVRHDADAAGAVVRQEFAALAERHRELIAHLPPIHRRVREFELPIDRLRIG